MQSFFHVESGGIDIFNKSYWLTCCLKSVVLLNTGIVDHSVSYNANMLQLCGWAI